jgi:ADP-ribose pyrophosphatase
VSKETWIESKTIYAGRIVTLKTGRVRLDDGMIAEREVVEHAGGVGVLPVFANHVLLVKQYRIAVDEYVLEMPAGRLEAGDSPETRAYTELIEETGYRAGRLERVASCYCSPGFTNELDHLFLAYDLEHVGAQPESEERIELVEMRVEEAETALAECAIRDAKTVIALREWLVRRGV